MNSYQTQLLKSSPDASLYGVAEAGPRRARALLFAAAFAFFATAVLHWVPRPASLQLFSTGVVSQRPVIQASGAAIRTAPANRLPVDAPQEAARASAHLPTHPNRQQLYAGDEEGSKTGKVPLWQDALVFVFLAIGGYFAFQSAYAADDKIADDYATYALVSFGTGAGVTLLRPEDELPDRMELKAKIEKLQAAPKPKDDDKGEEV
jgi:hypothetical protein